MLYDCKNHRLVFYKIPNTADWDQTWLDQNIKQKCLNLSKHNFVRRITKKFIHPAQGPTLEAGCGTGKFVFSLSKAGYETYGIDTAEKTIDEIKKNFPDLKVSVMDVRNLEFPDNFFAACWSLGVIEHFENGYQNVIKEMHRTLKPGGYIFLTSPTMSPLRKLKARKRKYPELTNQNKPPGCEFYQYALEPELIIKDCKKIGLKLIKQRKRAGIKGLKDEINALRKPLQWLTDNHGKNIIIKLFFIALDNFLAPITGHTEFFIFKKTDKSL